MVVLFIFIKLKLGCCFCCCHEAVAGLRDGSWMVAHDLSDCCHGRYAICWCGHAIVRCPHLLIPPDPTEYTVRYGAVRDGGPRLGAGWTGEHRCGVTVVWCGRAVTFFGTSLGETYDNLDGLTPPSAYDP